MARSSSPTEKFPVTEIDGKEAVTHRGSKRKISFDDGATVPECAVCLQSCVHPAQLPCGHVFCYLCIKGIAIQSKKCALCRQEIPSEFLENPELLEPASLQKKSLVFDDGYQWFYEGRNGWWQYEERTSAEIEGSFKHGDSSCEILICGVPYVVDFKQRQQYRKYSPEKKRRIKRDSQCTNSKGIAGIRRTTSGTSR